MPMLSFSNASWNFEEQQNNHEESTEIQKQLPDKYFPDALARLHSRHQPLAKKKKNYETL